MKNVNNCHEKYYGFRTRTHGWQEVLTVVSSAGASAVADLETSDGVTVYALPGHLTRFMEKRAGALDAFTSMHGIIELSRHQWVAKKRELGDAIY